VNLHCSIDKFRRILVHFLQVRQKHVPADSDSGIQDKVEGLAAMVFKIGMFGEGFSIEYFVK
jgi:hypothetical protein